MCTPGLLLQWSAQCAPFVCPNVRSCCSSLLFNGCAQRCAHAFICERGAANPKGISCQRQPCCIVIQNIVNWERVWCAWTNISVKSETLAFQRLGGQLVKEVELLLAWLREPGGLVVESRSRYTESPENINII